MEQLYYPLPGMTFREVAVSPSSSIIKLYLIHKPWKRYSIEFETFTVSKTTAGEASKFMKLPSCFFMQENSNNVT